MWQRIVRLLALGIMVGVFSGCAGVKTVPIRKLQDHPRDYADKPVTIAGTVVETYSVVLVKYFLLDDGTGRMAVVTRKPMPKTGSTVQVTGTLQDVVSLGDQQLLVLIEGGDLDLRLDRLLFP